MSAVQVLVVGVGGQGVLTAAQVLTSAAHLAGHSVAAGQLHGMSQRGGSVECSLRIGEARTSYMLGETVDLVLGFELLETLRAAPRVGPETVVLTCTERIVPSTVTLGDASYPDTSDVLRQLEERARRLVAVDGRALAKKSGQSRSLNAVLLGALAGLRVLPFGSDAILAALDKRCAPEFHAANRRAFELGLAETERGTLQEAVSE